MRSSAAQLDPIEDDGRTIGERYRVLGAIGRGGMAAVYRVHDPQRDREVALKQLLRDAPSARALFEREFYTLATIKHPGIIKAYDYGFDERGPYFTMDLLEGSDVRDVSPMPWRDACHHLRQVAASLALLHARNLVHRDVTPRNVRLTSDSHCKLMDFGALADAGGLSEVVGTPPCIPPEVLEGKPTSIRQDLYALGCLGYYMLTGGHAYPATDTRQLPTHWTRKPPPPSSAIDTHPGSPRALPAIPEDLDQLIRSLMRLEPGARPASAAAVIDRLDVLLGQDAKEDVSVAESYLDSSPLVGREGVNKRARSFLAQTLRGRGVSLTITGPSGSGRTRLLDELAIAAKLQGARVAHIEGQAHARPFSCAAALARKLRASFPALWAEATTEHRTLLEQLLGLDNGAMASVPPTPGDPGQWHVHCHAALRDAFLSFARHHPLALFVDDAHRMDEASVVVLSRLAHETHQYPLLLACSVCDQDEAVSESALSALKSVSQALHCNSLTPRQVETWLASLFDDTPNMTRLSRFLHERADGLPGVLIELLRWLFRRGELRYADGTWALPNEPSQMALPESADERIGARLDLIEPSLRALAEALCMRRGSLPLPLCHALVENTPAAANSASTQEALAAQLDALVQCGVMTSDEQGYRFASERVREHLLKEIAGDKRVALHTRTASVLLGGGNLAPTDQLEAGLHLLEAGDEQGVQLVLEAAYGLTENFFGLGSSVRLLESALSHFKSRGEGDARTLLLLAPLGIAAYTVDRKLDRHDEALLERLDRVAGLSLGRRLARFLGKRLGGLCGLGYAYLRYALSPRRDRPCGFRDLVRIGVSSALTLAGRAAICLDSPRVQHIADVLAPLSSLGKRHSAGYAYAYVEGLLLVTQDGCERVYQHFLELEALIERPGSVRDLPEASRQMVAGGIHYVLGVFESFAGDGKALSRAETLNQSGSQVHRLIAAQIRLQYHGFRGEAEQVWEAYQQVESCAIESGQTWQVETWSAIAINLFSSLWQDVILAKRSLDETRRMERELPSLSRYAITSNAVYQLLRGKPRDCIALYEQVLSEEAPFSRIGWTVSHGLLASAYVAVDEFQKARDACERVLSTAAPEDARYYAMRISVDTSYVLALAGLGDFEAAETYQAEVLARYEATASPFILGTVHETAARVAWMKKNRKAFTHHLKLVGKYFAGVGNAALIARFQRLSDLSAKGDEMTAKIALMREIKTFEAAVSPINDLPLAARHMLAWLMQNAEGFDGYLLVRSNDEPRLVAATSHTDPAPDVFEAVGEALRSVDQDGGETDLETQNATRDRRDSDPSHVFVLFHTDGGKPVGEGALVLVGRSRKSPPVRYELLRAVASQLKRLRELEN